MFRRLSEGFHSAASRRFARFRQIGGCTGIRSRCEAGGRVGLSDESLSGAGFTKIKGAHDEALAQVVRDIEGKLLGVELMSKLKKLDLGAVEFTEAKELAGAASDAVRARALGYALILGRRA